MVVAEGMGDEHCQASGAEKSHRRTGTTARRDYASNVERCNRVPLDKGNGADNLSDERQTVGATKPQSSATMSLAGRWMRRVRFGLLCRSLYRDQYASQIVPSLPAAPMLGDPAADPEEKRGPASDKNWYKSRRQSVPLNRLPYPRILHPWPEQRFL